MNRIHELRIIQNSSSFYEVSSFYKHHKSGFLRKNNILNVIQHILSMYFINQLLYLLRCSTCNTLKPTIVIRRNLVKRRRAILNKSHIATSNISMIINLLDQLYRTLIHTFLIAQNYIIICKVLQLISNTMLQINVFITQNS